MQSTMKICYNIIYNILHEKHNSPLKMSGLLFYFNIFAYEVVLSNFSHVCTEVTSFQSLSQRSIERINGCFSIISLSSDERNSLSVLSIAL